MTYEQFGKACKLEHDIDTLKNQLETFKELQKMLDNKAITKAQIEWINDDGFSFVIPKNIPTIPIPLETAMRLAENCEVELQERKTELEKEFENL